MSLKKRRTLAERTADRLLASLPGPDPIGIRIERGREASSQATNRPGSRAEQVPVAVSSAPLAFDALEQDVHEASAPSACRKAFEDHYGLNLAQMRGYYGRDARDLDSVWIGWEACWREHVESRK
jgi:hypothetical protein